VSPRLRLVALRVRGVLARALARAWMAAVPPHAQALVAGLPDTEENSLVTALALARRSRGEVLLVAHEPAVARAALDRVARVLDGPHGEEHAAAAARVVVVPKRGRGTFGAFVRSRLVLYTHGLFDSPRPVRGRLHVNLWHGSGPKWNGNANQSQRIGADVLAANNVPWGREVARALSMPSGTRIVPGNAREDVMLAARDRSALARLGLDPARPVLLWMPTFRTSGRAGRVGLREGEPLGGLGDPVLDALVAACAGTGVQLVLKTHRHDDDDYVRLGVPSLTTEDVLAAGLTLYELLGLADGLVSDYSSVWVDFLATGRPVALHCPDLESYERARGLNEPPLREVAGGLFLEDPAGAEELAGALAAGSAFRPAALAATLERLGVRVGGGSRADAMLDAVRQTALERLGTDLGIEPRA